MKALEDYSAWEMARRCALILLIFTVIFSALLAITHQLTQNAIVENIQKERLKTIAELLPPHFYDNDLLNDFLTLPPERAFGQKKESKLYIARKNKKVRAFLVEAVAREGYGGDIRLILAVSVEGNLIGAKVVAHQETPGLGDYIAQKGESAWIKQFQNRSPQKFSLTKDGGDIIYRSGATLSARATTNAISRALHFVLKNRHAFLKETDDAR